jgi:5-phospho-D-xylono-1,4-lactonase
MIRTVRGDIQPQLLGVTYPHEHLLTFPPANVTDPDLKMDSEYAAVAELSAFCAAGGSALVEMTTRDYGQAPQAMRRVSERSGAHVICTTGFIKETFSKPLVEGRSVRELADEMIRDVEQGIDGSDVRAGVIKAGSSLNQITPLEENVFRAAALAHKATGAPISTHTEAGTMALEQVALLHSGGVSPERVLIGHMDRLLDWDYHLAVARTGVILGFDQISKEKYFPDSQRVEFIARLVQEGFGKQIILSGDLARKSYWKSYGGEPGLTYILEQFVPLLKQQGLDQAAVDEILIHTPARLLQIS